MDALLETRPGSRLPRDPAEQSCSGAASGLCVTAERTLSARRLDVKLALQLQLRRGAAAGWPVSPSNHPA